jgi:hypothetical protein
MSTVVENVDWPDYFGRLLRWKSATLVSAVVALWVTMAEVDRLIAGAVPAGGGASRTAAGLQSLEAAARTDSWVLWQNLEDEQAAELESYLHIYAVADFLFALSYIILLWRVIGAHRWLRTLMGGVLACEVAESGLLIYLAGNFEAAGPATALADVARVKWVLLALFGISIFYYPVLRQSLAAGLRRTGRAVLLQRLSFFAVLVIAAMALIPIPGVSDQLPDAQRAWAGEGLTAHWRWALSMVVTGTAGLFVLGRRRSELAWDLYVNPEPKKPAVIGWWAYGPALVVVGLIWAAWAERLPLAPIFWWMLPFLGVVFVVVFFSLWLRSRYPSDVPPACPPDQARAVDAWRCGDVLSCSFLVVSGIALIRSFTGPVVLGLANGGLQAFGWSWLFLGMGWVTVLGAFPAMRFLLLKTRQLVAGPQLSGLLDPTSHNPVIARIASWVFLLLAAAALVFLLAFPAGTTRRLGVPATAVASVLAWTVVVGFLVVELQNQRAMWIFEKVGLRANPVVSLVLLTLFVGSLGGGDSRTHAIRETVNSQEQSGRLALADYFKQWRTANAGCTTAAGTGASTARVRPVIFVAAEGGGIRAAAWTAAAFEKLGEIPCARESVVLSSGVSGGSLGLVVSRLYGNNQEGDTETAVDVVAQLAGPDALAAGVAGALVGDLVAGGTDVLVGTGPATGSGAAWQDRAGAMESAWETSADRLAQRWEPVSPSSGRTGALVLNSTASGIGCRLLISQLDLDGVSDVQDAVEGLPQNESCREGSTPLSLDLLAKGACPLNLSWSTAAMLSARFPIISPAGRVPYRYGATDKDEGKCDAGHAYQAIDGGYSEGSGLGTIHDLWPSFQTELRKLNDAAGAEGPFLVPVFLFLQNSAGSDLIPGPPELAGELAVPLVGISAKNLQSDSTTWMQRLNAAANVCGSAALDMPDDGAVASESNVPPSEKPAEHCREATKAFIGHLGGNSVRVAPDSRPALDPPLGWTLSKLSQERLRLAMDAEAACPGESRECPPFARLLEALRN